MVRFVFVFKLLLTIFLFSISGELMHLQDWSKDIVVISSAKVAFELLDKRSEIYSDRPAPIMGGKL